MRWMNGQRALVAVFFLSLGVSIGSFACGSDDGADPADAGSDGPLFGEGGEMPDGFAGCATDTKKAERAPVDMIIGLDTSFSMDFDNKWADVRDALKAFVGNPAYASLGIGLQFFPIRKQCSVADYKVPAVAVDLQPKVATPIGLALDSQEMAGGTPIVPLLQGLSGYALSMAKADRKTVLVLATDGVPDDTCRGQSDGALANTLDNAVSVAKKAFEGKPSIPTFIIGVGEELTALNAISRAGGSGDAIIIKAGSTADVEKTFLAALDTIRGQSIPCDYAVPATGIDATKANVTYTPASGPQQTFVFVGKESECSKAPSSGWYFDNEQAPTKVILCSGACSTVKKDDLGRVDVVFGCPRVTIR